MKTQILAWLVLSVAACSVDELKYKTIGVDGCPDELDACAGHAGEGGDAGAGEGGDAGAGEGSDAGAAGEGGSDGGGGSAGQAGQQQSGGTAGQAGESTAGESGAGSPAGGESSSGSGNPGGLGPVGGEAGATDVAGAFPGEGGSGNLAGAGVAGGSMGRCESSSDCPALVTSPSGCAVATCNLDSGECEYRAKDGDLDGFGTRACLSQEAGIVVTLGDDCDDDDVEVNPNAWDGPEGDGMPNACDDQIDNDCSGSVDDDVLGDGTTCTCTPQDVAPCATTESGTPVVFPVLDADDMPLGACHYGEQVCMSNGAWSDCEGTVGPSAEICDGADNDCDGDVDDGVLLSFSYDADGDLHAPSWAATATGCSNPGVAPPDCESHQSSCPVDTWTTQAIPADDCDDNNVSRHPGAQELCNRIDDNCSNTDGSAEELAEDVDGDGFTSQAYAGCDGGYPRTDCYDQDPDVHPGQTSFFSTGYCLQDNAQIWCPQYADDSQKCAKVDTCLDSIGQEWGPGSVDYDCDGVEEVPVPTPVQIAAHSDACAAAPTSTCVADGAPTYPVSGAICGRVGQHMKCTTQGGGLPCKYASTYVQTACR